MEVLPSPFLSWQKSLLSGSLQIKFRLLTTRILFLTLARPLGEDGQSPLMEQPSSQLTTLLVPATWLILICMVNLRGKSWRVSWQKIECVSRCSVVIRSSCQNKTTKRKETYLLCCSHGLLVEENSSIEYDGDNVGPSNVFKEHLKRVKTTGHSKKGKKRMMCTTFLLNQNCMCSNCILLILM